VLIKSLVILIAIAVPAMAADNAQLGREVQFEGQSFTCGKIQDAGKERYFIHSTPAAKYIPEFQPASDDPLAKSWILTYRIICEGRDQQSNLIAHSGSRRF
jgi:hypothetical protein